MELQRLKEFSKLGENNEYIFSFFFEKKEFFCLLLQYKPNRINFNVYSLKYLSNYDA